MPNISVIVPVYKAEPYLRQCVDSILGQTLSDLELILVDDGSPDGCGAICDEYAAADRRVRVLHKENGGVAAAVADGIRAASADYVGFVDSDDWIDSTYYAELYTAGADADMAEGQYVRHFPADGWQRAVGSVRTGTRVYAGPEDIRRLTGQFYLSFLYDGIPDRPDRPLNYSRCDKLYRRKLLLEDLPYFQTPHVLAEDAVTNAAILPDCRKVVVCAGSARYHYRILPASRSHQAGEDQLPLIRGTWNALRRVAADKGTDPALPDAFVGSMIHARIYRTAGLTDVAPAERGRRMKAMLRQAPDGTLAAFIKVRKSAFLRLFYGLLRLGLAAPCVWMVTLHAALSGRKN